MRFIIFVLRFCVGLVLTGFSALSFAAFLGFASPLLDALNHFQPILFIGTLISLILTAILFSKTNTRAALVALGASGFLASAIVVVPEQVRQFFVQPVPANEQQEIKLMSHNLFGLNIDMGRMARIILEQDPDIIALQEYFEEQRQGLHSQIVVQYPYFASCAGRKHAHVALYSKTPFEVVEGTQCAQDASQENNPVAQLVTKFRSSEGVAFHVVTTHLNWPVQINPLFKDDLSVGEKYFALTQRKVDEWNQLSAAINQIDGPVVVAGDFNSTSWSYSMRQFLANTNLIRHSYGLLTYPKLLYIRGWREVPAFLPIDHMMASDDVQMHSVVVGEQTGSDHLPIFGRFVIGE